MEENQKPDATTQDPPPVPAGDLGHRPPPVEPPPLAEDETLPPTEPQPEKLA